MAARLVQKFSSEEVLKLVLDEDDEKSSQIDEESEEEDLGDLLEESTDRLDTWISMFDGGESCDNDFFKENAREAVLPIFRQSFARNCSSNKDAADLLRSTTLAVGAVLDSESRLWLNAIQRRLGGKVSIRKPYFCEISRSIPYGIFITLRTVVNSLKFHKPHCYVASNRKGEVISFTSFHLLARLFSLLSGLRIGEVKKLFFRKNLKGNRCKHKVKVIVTEEKDFAFIYKRKNGQMLIQFHYGEWNSFGCPQH